MIEHGPVKIDFVFSDVRMPGEMDGFGLSKWIKANRPDLPIVLTSAGTSKVNLADELCAHERVFAKPYDAFQVEAYIREVLAKRR
jgi:CheY-like chemotaxis protein